MTPRKTILRELAESPPGAFTRPGEIRGFHAKAPKFRQAINELLKDQLITGTQDEDGNMVVALCQERLPHVRKELRPWFATPLVWGGVVGVVVLAALGLLG